MKMIHIEKKQQTAVEWLVDEIEKHYIINNGSLNPTVIMELKRQAKEMEKQQILDAFEEGSSDGYDGWGSTNKEKYYNETYNK